jgi:hypothetical protein
MDSRRLIRRDELTVGEPDVQHAMAGEMVNAKPPPTLPPHQKLKQI